MELAMNIVFGLNVCFNARFIISCILTTKVYAFGICSNCFINNYQI